MRTVSQRSLRRSVKALILAGYRAARIPRRGEGTGVVSPDQRSLSALPREIPDYHQRQAAHLRSLAANATTVKMKARLLEEARKHEDIAQSEAEPTSASEG